MCEQTAIGEAISKVFDSRFGISVKNYPRNLFLVQKTVSRILKPSASKNGPNRPQWGSMGPNGPQWAPMGPYGPLWAPMGPGKTVW